MNNIVIGTLFYFIVLAACCTGVISFTLWLFQHVFKFVFKKRRAMEKIKNLGHILRFVVQCVVMFVQTMIVNVIGWFVVAYGVQNPRIYAGTEKPYTDNRNLAGIWMMGRLSHDWMLWWDNIYDGIFGDKRGEWNTIAMQKYGKSAYTKYAMWQWAAVRNSSNYFKRNIIGCDVSQCIISVLGGQEVVDEDNPGWQFIVATNKVTNKKRYYFGWVKRMSATHYAYIRFGWKIKMSHNGTPEDAEPNDKYKGFVFRASPWKAD